MKKHLCLSSKLSVNSTSCPNERRISIVKMTVVDTVDPNLSRLGDTLLYYITIFSFLLDSLPRGRSMLVQGKDPC